MTPCPHCGEPLADNATVCRECGSDAETGWCDDPDYYEVELPDDPTPGREPGAPPEYARVAAVIALIAILGSGLVFGRSIFAGLRSPLGKGALVVGVFIVTLFLLRMVRQTQEERSGNDRDPYL